MSHRGTVTDECGHEILELARKKAIRFVRGTRRRNDLEEIVTDLVLRVLARLPDYDSRRSSPQTFFHRVIDSAWADLCRQERAGKRDHRRESGSLNDRI